MKLRCLLSIGQVTSLEHDPEVRQTWSDLFNDRTGRGFGPTCRLTRSFPVLRKSEMDQEGQTILSSGVSRLCEYPYDQL